MKSSPPPLLLPSYMDKFSKAKSHQQAKGDFTYVANDEIHAVVVATESRVERPRPDLGVRVEGVGHTANVEMERLEAGELRVL